MRPAINSLAHTPTLNPLQSLIARRWRPQWVCQSCQHIGRQRQQHHQRRQSQWRSITTSTNTSIEKPYYVTTPIFYVNAAPHVGHMYTMIIGDVLKRWQQLKTRPALLCTGIDEHGLKVQQAAAKAGVPPLEFCDRGAEVFQDLAEKIDISADVFMRTTSAKHKDAVEYAWQMLQDKGLIYESKHEGWYSVSDETYYPQAQVQLIVDPPTGRKIMVSVETGKEVEWTSERNYHFRLSAFREKLLEHYQANPEFVVPKHRMEEVIKEVGAGLEDLSVSRPIERLTWGVRVPTDSSQTIYVWLDALLNYATAAGYPFTPGQERAGGWPADIHVVGKDIVRFHCIYWPAMLMALGLELPKQILTHAHWTLGRQKMAKSTGNVVNPFFALERFGVDVMRWYLVANGGIVDDADYDNRYIIEKYKKHLKGGLGNLSSRIMRGHGWNVPDAVKRFALTENEDTSVTSGAGKDIRSWHGAVRKAPAEVDGAMQALLPNKALKAISILIAANNGYLQKLEPWQLATRIKALREREEQTNEVAREIASLKAQLDRTIYLSAESLRMAGIMLQPFIPTSATKLLDLIGVKSERRSWDWCEIGKDDDYGVSFLDLTKRGEGILFPGLTSDF